MNRSLLHKIHLLIGATLGVPFLLLGLSGAILVFRPEMERMSDPVPQASLEMTKSVTEIVAAARAAAPAGATPFFFQAPDRPGDGAEVRFRTGNGDIFNVTVDPGTSAVLAARPFFSGFLRQLHDFHENFSIREYGGRSIIGWLGVGMLFLGCSGLIMWWPRGGRWRDALQYNQRTQGWPLLREIHRTAGFWTLSVFIVVCFSGTYIAFRTPLPTPTVASVQGASPIDLDQIAQIARKEAPDQELRQIAIGRPNQALRMTFAKPGALRLSPMTMVFVDQWTGSVAEVRNPENYSLYESFIAWQRPIHSGDGLGWWWRILVFLSGFLPPLFAITGTAMWWLKRRATRRKNAWAQ